MTPIPIDAAREIAERYGYDQVLIYARKVGEDPAPHGEHMTTYGVSREHCSVAARMAAVLQRFMGWQVEKIDSPDEDIPPSVLVGGAAGGQSAPPATPAANIAEGDRS